jgi:hypothetical protein
MKPFRTALAALAFAAGALTASAQLETAFTYQGRLMNTNGSLDGFYDFVFSLYDNAGAQMGVSLTNPAVKVDDGHFGVILDFGPDSFRRYLIGPHQSIGPGEWLEISVRTNKSKPYQVLSPRQRLTPTPYASTVVGTLPSSAIEGNYSGKVSFGNASNVFVGKYYGDGANLTNVGGGTLWQTTGNTGTTPGTHFLGTTDSQPLELRVNGERVLRLEPKIASPNIVGGFVGNYIAAGYFGAVVAGGGANEDTNRVKGSYGTVSGGSGNATDSGWATVGGGRGNTVQAASSFGTIGGGSGNNIASDAGYSVIGGGTANIVSDERSTIGGGSFNQANGGHASIGGGERNQATSYATVAGGYRNKSTANYAAIGGGMTNTASGLYSAVGGGENNLVSGGYSTIGGGVDNRVIASYSVVSGGRDNLADGGYAVVSGGWAGQASGSYATVVGGSHNIADGTSSLAAGRYATAAHNYSFIWSGVAAGSRSTTGDQRFEIHAPGGAYFYTDTNAVYASGNLSCATLTIRGGADLAEPFAISDESVQPGAVVVIDPDQPGRLKLSTSAYDNKVAGIVSGAGDVQPGISMIQTEKLEGGRNVALSGRVYALVDASKGPVRPGDLLTTSDTPGHAMKAANPALAQGAILGKAMTPLPEGRGLVLVLVSLQ